MQKSNINQNIMACGMEKLSVQRCDKIYDHKDRNRIVCHKYDASRWMCLAVKAQGPPRRPSTNLRKWSAFFHIFLYRVSWNRLRFCRVAFCKFSRAIVIPSALRRIWRSDIAASGKVTSASWTWPTTQFQWLKTITYRTYTMDIHGPFMIIYVHPLSTNAISISSLPFFVSFSP